VNRVLFLGEVETLTSCQFALNPLLSFFSLLFVLFDLSIEKFIYFSFSFLFFFSSSLFLPYMKKQYSHRRSYLAYSTPPSMSLARGSPESARKKVEPSAELSSRRFRVRTWRCRAAPCDIRAGSIQGVPSVQVQPACDSLSRHRQNRCVPFTSANTKVPNATTDQLPWCMRSCLPYT
jgi:hypothetical protein